MFSIVELLRLFLVGNEDRLLQEVSRETVTLVLAFGAAVNEHAWQRTAAP